MADQDKELEVKYYIADLPALEARLKSLGANLEQPRVHEMNLRFDRDDGELRRNAKVLRLRKDTEARLTFKGPSEMKDGARLRQEIEFVVSDFQAAWRLFDALGYRVALMYEKYRTTYKLDEVHVTLDEMPYGDFTELEGPNGESIRAVNQKLGLNWNARAPDSYAVLFEQLKRRLQLPFRDLTFDNFRDIKVVAEELNLRPADQ